MSQQKVQQFREEFRQKYISPRYSGPLHFSLTLGTTSLVIFICLWMLSDVTVWEWMTIPITFLYANLAEYLVHKGPMHHKTRFLGLIFQRHTKEHHSFFTKEETTFDGTQDYYAVLFPPVMLVFFFGFFALPVGTLIYLLLSPNVAFLFVFTAVAYFLNYEILHFCYHLAPDHWVSKLPFMKNLRKHHTYHHDQKLMSNYNFNITYPICDWLFKTMYVE